MGFFEGEDCMRGLERDLTFKEKEEEEKKRRTKIRGHGTC